MSQASPRLYTALNVREGMLVGEDGGKPVMLGSIVFLQKTCPASNSGAFECDPAWNYILCRCKVKDLKMPLL